MPVTTNIDIEAAPVGKPWLPASQQGSKLKPSAGTTTHTDETDERVFEEADWVYLQVIHEAYQIHPATIEELGKLGPIGGPNMERWTIEGPLLHRPGDPGAGSNCTISVQVAYSLTSSAGSDWREYRPGRYKLRAVKARLVITRPDTTYDFRVTRLATRATRVAAPMRDTITERFFSNA